MELIWQKLLSLLIKLVPGLVLRHLLKVDQISRDLELDLRSSNPVDVVLESEIPSISIWLRCTNKAGATVRIDRFLLEIWIDQPVIEGSILKPVTVLPKETKNVLFKTFLSGIQKESILKRVSQRATLNAPVTINIEACCKSKVGNFEKIVTKEYLLGKQVGG